MAEKNTSTRIIEKLLRKRVIGGNHISIETVTAWFPSHKQGEVKSTIKKLIHDPESPVVSRGTNNSEISLSSIDEAVAYLESTGQDIPFGIENSVRGLKGRASSTADETESDKSVEDHVQELRQEVSDLEEAAADWRSEARRRQRASVIFGIAGFIVGALSSGAITLL